LIDDTWTIFLDKKCTKNVVVAPEIKSWRECFLNLLPVIVTLIICRNTHVQLKRLELKLKQFAEIETMLLKESERFELMRQQLAAQRARVLSARCTSTGVTVPGGGNIMVSNPMSQATSPRPPLVPGSMPQASMLSMPGMYTNNMQGHQMALLQQQQRQQMLSLGPRLPLSAINPGSSSSAPNMMFNSGMPNHHPMFRPPSGNNPNVG
jgi:SWI/SNF related-matrix-associated actin-dependent regulator of chromatin subfamily C